MRTQMPENIDTHYHFIGGRYTYQDLAYRMIGLPIAIPSVLVVGVISNFAIGAVIGAFVLALGFVFGSKKVFDKQIPGIQALYWKHKLDKKSKIMYNRRDYNNKIYDNASQENNTTVLGGKK